MRYFRELNQQINEVKRMLNNFIQKLTAQVEILKVVFIMKVSSIMLVDQIRFPEAPIIFLPCVAPEW